jgi:tetratricopeptide (TPR) repeat protein
LPEGHPLPTWIWSLSLPLVAVVEELEGLWHHHRLWLPHCALAFADPANVYSLERAGMSNVRVVERLKGWLEDDRWAKAGSPLEHRDRLSDNDVLLTGLPHPSLNHGGLASIRTWARLGERYRVVCTQARGKQLAQEICAARLAVVRGQDQDRYRIEDFARAAGVPCILDDAADEAIIARILEEDPGECQIGANGKLKAPRRAENPCHDVWRRMLSVVDAEWDGIRQKQIKDPVTQQWLLLARCRHLLAAGPRGDPSLIADLSRSLAKQPDNPALHAAMGVATLGYARGRGNVTAAEVNSALEEFRRSLALDAGQSVARLNMIELLGLLGQKDTAAAEARLALAYLDRASDEAMLTDDPGHVPPLDRGVDEFAAAWEQAGLLNAGKPAREAIDKRAVLRWRLHHLLAELTGGISHYFEAALAYPQSSATRAALGCALAKGGKVADALPHLQMAVDANPLDVPAARNLYKALAELGHVAGQRRVARDLWVLGRIQHGSTDFTPPRKGAR